MGECVVCMKSSISWLERNTREKLRRQDVDWVISDVLLISVALFLSLNKDAHLGPPRKPLTSPQLSLDA